LLADEGAKILGNTLSVMLNLRLLNLNLSKLHILFFIGFVSNKTKLSNKIKDFGVKSLAEGISCCKKMMDFSLNLSKSHKIRNFIFKNSLEMR